MKVEIVGIQSCDFYDDDKNHIVGMSLKCLKDVSNKKGFVGRDIHKAFINEEMVDEAGFVPEVGQTINLHYDIDGRRSFLVGYSEV